MLTLDTVLLLQMLSNLLFSTIGVVASGGAVTDTAAAGGGITAAAAAVEMIENIVDF